MKRALTLFLIAATCGQCAAQATKLAILRGTMGVDAEQQLGCKRGVSPTFTKPNSSGNNATRIETGFSSATQKYSTFVPGGDWEIPTTIDIPAKTGVSLFGAGGTASDAGETQYDGVSGDTGSPQVTRLIWTGADEGEMLADYSASGRMEGLHIQGCRISGAGPEPTGGTYPNRAKIGLHIYPSGGTGALNTAKKHIEKCSFHQIHTGILLGLNLDDVGEATYTGDNSSHCDTLFAEDLAFIYPWTGTHAGVGTAIHIRNDQSFDNVFGQILCSGNPEQVFYLERGGKTNITHITHSGNGSWVIRVGIINANSGGLTVGYASLDGGTTAKLLKGDVHTSSIATAPVVIENASIPESCNAVLQIDVGPGTWTIKNTNYLKAGSIKMTGPNTAVSGGTKRQVCHVILDNCTTYGCSIEDLVDPASSGSYLLTWRNMHCSREGPTPPAQAQDYGLPFEDSTPETRISNSIDFLEKDEP
jgi:hypothetical protein